MSGSAPGFRYRRLLLKLSGEALMGKAGYGIDVDVVVRLCREMKEAVEAGAELAVVVGGGNIFRGLAGAAKGMDRATADYMGMLATVMNALALQSGLERLGVAARTLSAIPMPTVCESSSAPRRCITWSAGASSSSQPVQAIHSSPPTPRQPCGPRR